MARNGIFYDGRLVLKKSDGSPRAGVGLFSTSSGKRMLRLVVSEQFRQRNDRAPQEFRDPAKAADAYVNTYTAWHKLDIYASPDNQAFIDLITDPEFAHGAVVEIQASYEEEKPWTDNSGKEHAGRKESIYMDSDEPGFIAIKVVNDERWGAKEEHQVPFWDGSSTPPALKGSGGGGSTPQYRDDEGF